MTGTTQQAKYFQIIEYILFFGLIGLSGIFMHEVLDKFFTGKSNFSQSYIMKNLNIQFHNSGMKTPPEFINENLVEGWDHQTLLFLTLGFPPPVDLFKNN